ncbi:zinc-finger homeodomain protein 8-like [Dioscorea cayenensis subsp. rotundata]|uniref:Zinc-finger homeodomain protein 8-like n=1 Tax=Dioscorea cayennensis subsp. rotundata TaxID=55577 RepID=A0AB40CBZ4_DIOCR|nr:zinc-finger homeodomain protein 8-like [Dioscorea cayenensis subsp. rotundata]
MANFDMANFQECMRNFAAQTGGFVRDGCQQYLENPTAPEPNTCAACGCHRNFHRMVIIRNHVHGPNNEAGNNEQNNVLQVENPNERLPRTRFSDYQRHRMNQYAGQLHWIMPRSAVGNAELASFCAEIGITRHSFQIWMNNQRNRR